MTHTYKVSGMTCSGCQVKVQGLLSKVPHVKNVSVDLTKGNATISMDHHIPTEELRSSLKDYPKYMISEEDHVHHETRVSDEEAEQSWIITYKPILLIFGYITGISLIIELMSDEFVWMRWMSHFMAGFFLVFSFFKLLDLKGFAESYSTYDILAKRWVGWGYVYAFIELALGIALLAGFNPIVTNAVTFIVMLVSIIGVLQSVLNKRKIKCACLGAVFNLPMSTVTVVEDALMITMSAIMIVSLL